MLRITVTPESDVIRLKLEGDLAGAWVTELEESWRAAHSTRGDRRLNLDLTAVERVDMAGGNLLGLFSYSGAPLRVSRGPMSGGAPAAAGGLAVRAGRCCT